MPIHLPPISRRRFLAGSLAAGAGLLVPRSLWAAEKPTDANRWAFFSDTHIWQRRDGLHKGVKPAENFVAVTKELLALDPRPAGLIVAGDCAYMDGDAGDYTLMAQLLGPIRAAGIPVHLVLGNHDHRDNFWAAFPDAKPQRPHVADRQMAVVDSPRACWVLLDSLEKTHFTPGSLGKPQLDWLAKTLDERTDKPVLVVAHHYLSMPGGLQDSGPLWETIAGRKQAKAYIFGHSHTWTLMERDRIHLVNIPATAWVFAKTQPNGWVDAALRPGGITLTLSALDKEHPKHGERVELKWRG